MKHILFIDSLDKLVIEKDSSLMLALTLKKMGLDLIDKDEIWNIINDKNIPNLKSIGENELV